MTLSFQRSRLFKPVGRVMAVLALSLAFPYNLFAYDPNRPTNPELPELPTSRELTVEEMSALSGRTMGNPYYTGNLKFDPLYKGVNLRTGEFTLSATDLGFEGGYGIPINLTRTYAANAIGDGPLGWGWKLSVDLRTTAGGLLKSGTAPVRSVPIGIRRRPGGETDPNIAVDPIEAYILTDAQGKEHTVQRDVDGILTTPPWDKNQYNPEYERIEENGNVWWVLISSQTITPEGTVYQYSKQGYYANGIVPWDDPQAPAEPSNVLKVTTVTDRHGNVTEYNYGSTYVNYSTPNGTTTEYPITSIDMPNGRTITFTYDSTGKYLDSASDGVRTVDYTVTSGQLTAVTSPGGRTTVYDYDQAVDPQGVSHAETELLTYIKNPQGLETEIHYLYDAPSGYNRAMVWRIVQPDGLYTDFVCKNYGILPPDSSIASQGGYDPHWPYGFVERFGGQLANQINVQRFQIVISSATVLVDKYLGHSFSENSLQKMDWYQVDNLDLIDSFVTYWTARPYPDTVGDIHTVETTKTYNFMGNPLSEVVTEKVGGNTIRTHTSEYAYWGEDRFFQQKAVRAKTGAGANDWRYSFTDVHDDQAALGSKGQIYKTYSSAHATFDLGTSWKYDIQPAQGAIHAAEFAYDSKGRSTDVWKLQKIVSGTPSYVRTQSAYGADGSPTYGNAVEVTEDSGGINRTTETLAFHVSGKALRTRDALGREFDTAYDGDGNVLSVTRTDTTPDVPIASYSYGATANTIENGLLVSAVDEQSGVQQDVTYVQSGAAVGLPNVLTETNGSETYTVDYDYSSLGDREFVTYTVGSDVTRWHFKDYVPLGFGTSPARVFERMNRQSWSGTAWEESSEEMAYAYDALGRLKLATFAQTPQPGEDDYESYTAASRGLASYAYDPAGRISEVKHWWQVWNTQQQQYDATPIFGTAAAYSTPLGIKTSMSFLSHNGTGGWQTDRTEYYTYDANTDWLTSVDYNDGLANEVTTWTYDAAGNRASDTSVSGSWTYDNLNRMTASPHGTYENDLVGNRTKWTQTANSDFYSWDELNRMLSWHRGPIISTNSKVHFQYRADGMRVKKTDARSSPSKVTKYYYDGSMGIQDAWTDGTDTLVTKYGVGARGIDVITKKLNTQSEQFGYPIFDLHGNMIATLARSGTNSYSTGNVQYYDVWGGVRSGSSTEDQGYVADLGHRKDSESGLIYMRARYYEPATGRFVSQDRQMYGRNWLIYASNNPVNNVDESGGADVPKYLEWLSKASKYLWILQTLISVVQMTQGIEALITFVGNLHQAKDGTDVENAYGEFMKDYDNAYSSFSFGTEFSLGLKLVQGVITFMTSTNPYTAAAKTCLSGVFMGVQLAILVIGYTMRMAWYIGDIDNF